MGQGDVVRALWRAPARALHGAANQCRGSTAAAAKAEAAMARSEMAAAGPEVKAAEAKAGASSKVRIARRVGSLRRRSGRQLPPYTIPQRR